MNPTEAVRNQKLLVRFQEVTNDFPLGFTVSQAHITPLPNTVNPRPPSSPPIPFLPGKAERINHRDGSMPLIGLLHKAV